MMVRVNFLKKKFEFNFFGNTMDGLPTWLESSDHKGIGASYFLFGL